MKRFLLILPLAMIVLACNGTALAATWPDIVAPCDTTLQACVNAQVAGATVEIDALAPEVVGVTLQLPRPITLKSGPAARGQFRDSAIIFNANAAGTSTTTLENLRLVNSPIFVGIGSNTAADQQTVRLEGLEVIGTSVTVGIQFATTGAASQKLVHVSHLRYIGSAIGVGASGTVQAAELLVRDSHFILTGRSASAGDLQILSGGSRIRWDRNRVESLVDGGNQICLLIQTHSTPGPGVVTASIRRNEFLGCREAIRLDPRQIAIDATVQNNTFQRALFNIANINVGPAATTLRLSNNAFANSSFGMPQLPGTLNILNNLYFNSPPPAVAETGRIVANPQFIDANDLRLLGGSPARDAGAGAEIPLLDSDFDGQRAVIGAAPDIGAHEWSDALSIQHTSTSTNTISNFTKLPTSAFVTTLDLPQVMSVGNSALPLPAWAPNHIGLFSDEDLSFSVFNQQSSTPMSLGQTYFAMRNGLRDTSVEHIANAASSTSFPNVTRLDHPRLNGQTAVTPVVTQRWNPTGSAGTYNNRAVGLWYNASRWNVYNQDNAAMPDGAGFHVLVPELFNDYAFRVDVPSVRGAQILDHPRLNHNPCAHLVVSTVYGNPFNVAAPGVNTPSNLLVRYNEAPNQGGYWIVYRGDGANIAAGAAFHVYVDPVRSRQCTQERIFADGLE